MRNSETFPDEADFWERPIENRSNRYQPIKRASFSHHYTSEY